MRRTSPEWSFAWSTTVRLRAPLAGLAVLACSLGAACAHEWDDYDPRLGGGGSAVASSSSESIGPNSAGGISSSSAPSSSSGQVSSGDGGGGDGGQGPGPGPTSSTADVTGGSTSTGTPTETLEIVAVEADCTDPAQPDADDCDFDAATNAFTIDAEATPPNQEWIGYLRFSPGSELAGKTVDVVRLRLFVSTEDRADSDHSGEVWETEPFDRNDLDDGAPDFLGSAPVGASVGPVDLGQEVTFDLVGVTVAADTPIYFALDTDSIDGVDYLDERSATPPTLVVTYH